MKDVGLAEQFMRIRESICRATTCIKEFDKAVTVMKAGAKIMKAELARRGHRQLGQQVKARVQRKGNL